MAAGFILDDDPGNQGCGGPNPDYVPYEDSDLFELTLDVSDVEPLPKDASVGVTFPRLDAGPEIEADATADGGQGDQ